MTYSLATINWQGRPTPVLKVGSSYFALQQVAPALLTGARDNGLLSVFDNWERNEGILSRISREIEGGTTSASSIKANLTPDDFLTPLRYPSKVVCMGANYYLHMHSDAGMPDFQKEKVVPTMFVKPASTTLVGSGKSVRYPSQSRKLDWEIELCAIIGKRARKIRAQDARDHIAAFTIGIDLSARDWQFHPKHPFKIDLFGGKAFDDSCPLGPTIVPARFVDDGNLQLRLSVNGHVKQDANTRDMIWPLEEQIEAMSMHVTLEPGDIIMTGTPAGVGMKTGTYLEVGDKLAAEIEGLGILHVEIMPDAEMPR